MTDSATLDLFDNAGTLLQTANIALKINPSLMTCTATPSNTAVTATNIYLFSITPNPSVPLASTGSLDLVFPSIWSNSLTGPAFVYSSCSNTGGTVSCSVTGQTVTASGLFTAATTTSAFSFSLDSVVNPGSI